jgi:hypothetical protein
MNTKGSTAIRNTGRELMTSRELAKLLCGIAGQGAEPGDAETLIRINRVVTAIERAKLVGTLIPVNLAGLLRRSEGEEWAKKTGTFALHNARTPSGWRMRLRNISQAYRADGYGPGSLDYNRRASASGC